jgi:transcriptional regulator with XRE-family HTH domain
MNENLPLRLRQLRADNALTQEQAAKRIKISLRHYGRLERGEDGPRADTIRKIARAYKIDPSVLTSSNGDRVTATRQQPTVADFARLEAKIDALRDDFRTHIANGGLEMPQQLADLLRARTRPRPTGRRKSS